MTRLIPHDGSAQPRPGVSGQPGSRRAQGHLLPVVNINEGCPVVISALSSQPIQDQVIVVSSFAMIIRQLDQTMNWSSITSPEIFHPVISTGSPPAIINEAAIE